MPSMRNKKKLRQDAVQLNFQQRKSHVCEHFNLVLAQNLAHLCLKIQIKLHILGRPNRKSHREW